MTGSCNVEERRGPVGKKVKRRGSGAGCGRCKCRVQTAGVGAGKLQRQVIVEELCVRE